MAAVDYADDFFDRDIGNVLNWEPVPQLPTSVDDVTMDMVGTGSLLTVDLVAKTYVWITDPAAPNNAGNHKFTAYGNADFSFSDHSGAWNLISGFNRLYIEFAATGIYTPPSASPTYSLAATAGTVTPSTALTGTKKCQIIDFTGASALNMTNGSITADGNATIGTGGITNGSGKTLTVGGNCVINGSVNGLTQNVTGTNVAHNATITNFNATGTTLTATDNCINGGGNTNVTFASGGGSSKTKGAAVGSCGLGF